MPTQLRKAIYPVVCLLAGVLILLLASRLADTRSIHFFGVLNDQVAYLNAGRSLATRGTLESNSIFPATLWQKKSRTFLYMPGHPLALAVSFTLFGVGPFQSIIPSLVSYLISMLAIYLLGARLYSRAVGLIASLMFALFPPILFLAFTAMAELTVLAAFTVAVCIWMYLPVRLRPWLGPVVFALPFLFRETAAFVVPALGLYFWLDRREKMAWRSVAFVALSVVLLGAIYRADFSYQRPNLMKASILLSDPMVIYTNAVEQQRVSQSNWVDVLRVLPKRVVFNAGSIFDTSSGTPFEDFGRYVVIATMVFVALIALFLADKLAISFSVFNLINLVAQTILYRISGFVGLRCLLFTYALSVVVVAPMLVRILSRVHGVRDVFVRPGIVNRRIRQIVLQVSMSLVVVGFVILTLAMFRSMYFYFSKQDATDRRCEAVLETLSHDDTRMLVAPVQLSVRYSYDHFPVMWSFPPQNAATLGLLAARFDIGTLVLDAKHPLLENPSALAARGFYSDGEFTLGAVNYLVYHRLPQIQEGQ